MEVVCGEHGDSVHKLVTAVSNGKCNNYNQPLSRPTSFGLDETCTIKMGDAEEVFSKKSCMNKQDVTTVVNIPSISEKFQQKAIVEESASALIESKESDLEKGKVQKYTFPTSGYVQFWILLKRSFVSITRDKALTHMRLFAHIIVGAIIGMIYYGIGNDADKM